MTRHHPQAVTLVQFSCAFVAFGVLLIAALLWPETTEALNLDRTRATIWVTSALLGVALVLYPFCSLSVDVNNLSGLFWSFAWVGFLVHVYLAVFIIFGGIADTFRQMGVPIASANFLLMILWTLDVLLLWLVKREQAWIEITHLVIRIFTFLVFALTLLVLRGGSARILGAVFTAAILIAVGARILVQTGTPDVVRRY